MATAELTRREILAGLGLLALGGCASRGADEAAAPDELARLLDEVVGVDMHSHAAGATGRREPAYDLAARIRLGRMTAVCLQHSGDAPVTGRDAANRVRILLILSHTNLSFRPLEPYTRLISPEHGRLVASTGGVVGIWASPTFAGLGRYVDAVVRAVETLGVDHVGLGSDNSGFGRSQAAWTDYADFPSLARLLRDKGLSAADIGKLAGGNYVHVFDQSVG